jgi:hypothetical protein
MLYHLAGPFVTPYLLAGRCETQMAFYARGPDHCTVSFEGEIARRFIP